MSGNIKTDIHYIVGATSFFEQRISTYVREYLIDADRSYRTRVVDAWTKLFNLTLTIMLRKYVKLTYAKKLNEKINTVETSRRTLELLQDVLAQDVGNYNLVIKMSAELLQSNLMKSGVDREENLSLTRTVLKAINDATQVVTGSKELDKIASVETVELSSINLEQYLCDAVDLVTKSYPLRTMTCSIVMNPSLIPVVHADNF
jgi:hypothetical protein